ncbi:MAG: type II secretion system protein [Ruminiclostridium sp.]|nr:type II secretion system protein [Ruminiclostridium sp.]
MKKLLKKKAFTLVELIVAMAVMVILIAAAMGMFNPVKGIIKMVDEDTVTNAVTDTLTNYISEKLKTASTYNIKGYTSDQLLADASEAGSPAKMAATMISGKEENETVYAIVLRSTSKGYQLYDLGKLNNSTGNFTAKATAMKDTDKYAVFNREYYNDSRYKFTFTTTSGDKGTWCRMGVNTYDENGDLKISERVQMFKLLNMSLLNLTPSSAANLADYTYSDDLNIVILYKIKVFG